MTPGLIFILVIVAISIAFIVAPLLRKDATAPERVAAADDESIELASRHKMILASLRDLEDDHNTGKVSEEDYPGLQSKLTREAVDLMKQLDALEQERKRLAASKTLKHPRSYPKPRSTP